MLGCTSRNVITNYMGTLEILNHWPHPDFSREDLGAWIGWVTNPLLKKQKLKNEIDSEYYSRDKRKQSGQLPQCNFYFVVLVV